MYDTFFYWKDISTNHFYRSKLIRFGESLRQAAPNEDLPFFLFCNTLDDLQDAPKTGEAMRAARNRQVVVVQRNGNDNHQALWTHLNDRLYDIIEWTGEDDLIEYSNALAERNRSINAVLHSPLVQSNLIGESAAWQQFLRGVIEAALFSQLSILLIGESGTGKELVSRLVHTIDKRAQKKELVLVDCTTIVPELAGSEFFGHEKGAYTNALQTREGAFALAHEGTLFLDEVGEMPLPLQAELLRVIQEGTYKKIGSNVWHHTRFRLVCATNKDLQQQVQEGRFRQDLYFRIADFQFRVPPLRERAEDIPLLARHFLSESFPGQHNLSFEDSVMAYLVKRSYTGNVRELRQLVRRIAVKHVKHKKITVGEIPAQDRTGFAPADPPAANDLRLALRKAIVAGCNLWELKNITMEEAICIALELSDGNKEVAARRLGVTWRAILQFRKKNNTGKKENLHLLE